MAYIPDNKKYLTKDWAGTVTANDLAIQNRGYSLGQPIGPTPEMLAQKEKEDWFRARGLDPNQYYEGTGGGAPQPGFNPAGVSVNNGKPLKQQEIYSGGRTKEQFEAQAAANKAFEKQNEVRFDRKAAEIAFKARVNAPNVPATPSVPGMPAGAPVRFDNGSIDNVVPETPMAPIPGFQNTATPAPTTQPPRMAPGMPLPNYTTPNAGAGGSVIDILNKYQTGGMALPPMQTGQPPQPTGSPLPQSGTAPAQSFGSAAKLLQLPSYLRRGMSGINTGRGY